MADVDGVEVVVAHHERATLRVGDVFVKVDSDQARLDREIAAMALAPVPTPVVVWRNPPALAVASVRGTALGRLGERSAMPASAWGAAGAAVRRLHDAPLPPWPGPSVEDLGSRLAEECDGLVADGILPVDVVARTRRLAELVLVPPAAPVFVHGDLQVCHVFLEGDEVTGVIDWSEAAQGDAASDLATLALANEEHLDDLLAGYGGDVDLDRIRAWWAWRCLTSIRWLVEAGYGAPETFPEVAVLRSLA
jgi:aminoglycoside phosphotransferase (APT) family kinase protein